MSFIKVNLTYKKYKNLKLIERIKFEKSDEYFYFTSSDSFLCNHVEIFRKSTILKSFLMYLKLYIIKIT